MSFLNNKPHVWVGHQGSYYFLKIHASFPSGKGIIIDADNCHEETVDNALNIYFRIHSMESFISPLNYELGPATGSTYDPGIHDKVTVVFTNADGTPISFHTVKPVLGDFSTSGNVPPPVPFMYLRTFSTSESIIHIEALIPDTSKYTGVSWVDDFVKYKRTVTFAFTNDRFTASAIKHYDHKLDETTGYDPVLEDIVVELVMKTPRGALDRKGSGTTHGSEGDASGED